MCRAFKWDKETTEQLIGFIEEYPVLYNTQLKEYKNTVLQAQARASIAKEFEDCGKLSTYITLFFLKNYDDLISFTHNVEPDDVKLKFKSLKDQFNKEKKAIIEEDPTGTGLEESQKKNRTPWMFYEQLTFLLPHIKQRKYVSLIAGLADFDV